MLKPLKYKYCTSCGNRLKHLTKYRASTSTGYLCENCNAGIAEVTQELMEAWIPESINQMFALPTMNRLTYYSERNTPRKMFKMGIKVCDCGKLLPLEAKQCSCGFEVFAFVE